MDFPYFDFSYFKVPRGSLGAGGWGEKISKKTCLAHSTQNFMKCPNNTTSKFWFFCEKFLSPQRVGGGWGEKISKKTCLAHLTQNFMKRLYDTTLKFWFFCVKF